MSSPARQSSQFSSITFDDVKRYIATRDLEDPSIGGSTLLDLRKSIQDNEADHDRLRKDLINKRARQKAAEIQKLVADQQVIREKKIKESSRLAELRLAKQEAEEKELRAGLERERVLRQVRERERVTWLFFA